LTEASFGLALAERNHRSTALRNLVNDRRNVDLDAQRGVRSQSVRRPPLLPERGQATRCCSSYRPLACTCTVWVTSSRSFLVW
jgi:hypothetical protein